MKIAIVSPIKESVPPLKYGPIEYEINNLAIGFNKAGHQTTVYCTGDSPATNLYEKFYITDKSYTDSIYPNEIINAHAKESKAVAFEDITKRGDYDLILDFSGPAFTKRYGEQLGDKLVNAISWTLEDMKFRTKYLELEHGYIVTISDSQKKLLDGSKRPVYRVYNAINIDDFEYNPTPEEYYSFLGRIDPRKGIKLAIDFALKTGTKLKIGARIDLEYKEYYEKEIKPFVDGEQITYLGELDSKAKVELLKNSIAMLFPANTNEAFGNVLIEANACGTPVLSFITGATPEIIKDGYNGYLCEDLEDMIEKSKLVKSIDRSNCRKSVEENFTIDIMVKNYLEVFNDIIKRNNERRTS